MCGGVYFSHLVEVLLGQLDFDDTLASLAIDCLTEQLHTFLFGLSSLHNDCFVCVSDFAQFVLQGVGGLLRLLEIGFRDFLLVVLFGLRNDDLTDFLALGYRLLGQVNAHRFNFGHFEAAQLGASAVLLEELIQGGLHVGGHGGPIAKEFGEGHAAHGRPQRGLAALAHVQQEVAHLLYHLFGVDDADLCDAVHLHSDVVFKESTALVDFHHNLAHVHVLRHFFDLTRCNKGTTVF